MAIGDELANFLLNYFLSKEVHLVIEAKILLWSKYSELWEVLNAKLHVEMNNRFCVVMFVKFARSVADDCIFTARRECIDIAFGIMHHRL